MELSSSSVATFPLFLRISIDICHHIIISNDWPNPETHKEAIEIIAANGVMPEEFAKHISPMAGLRNILIHEYVKIDAQRIYAYLQNTSDFREFQRYIAAYLTKADRQTTL